jgi:hypothetical protein
MVDPGREVPFVVGDKTYTLYAGNRALRLIERQTGMTFVEAIGRLQSGSLDVMTAMLWALLQQKHPELDSVNDADDLIDVAGYESIGEAIQSAVERAFPDAVDEANASPNGARPGKPAVVGIGKNSSRAASRPA